LFKLAKEWWVTGKEQQEEWRKMNDIDHLTQNPLIFIAQAKLFRAALPGELLYPVGTL
jgi:hypothetical protein